MWVLLRKGKYLSLVNLSAIAGVSLGVRHERGYQKGFEVKASNPSNMYGEGGFNVTLAQYESAEDAEELIREIASAIESGIPLMDLT